MSQKKKARPSEQARRIAQRRRPKPAYTQFAKKNSPAPTGEREPGRAAETQNHAQNSRPPPPVTHHLDRRAASLLAIAGDDDDALLTTEQTAGWLGVSSQFLEIGRTMEYGPRFSRIGPRCIRYRVGDVKAWLVLRTYSSTKGYADREKRDD